MSGPLDPRSDKWMRAILLDQLRGKLAAYDWDKLDLHHLEPLRAEVAMELARITQPEVAK